MTQKLKINNDLVQTIYTQLIIMNLKSSNLNQITEIEAKRTYGTNVIKINSTILLSDLRLYHSLAQQILKK